jgi:hypothetical protein
MSDLFREPPTYPDSVLLSIYNAYPRRTGRPAALKRINEALNRICQGEIDGSPRTQAEAIEFLREKTEEARQQMAGREQNWIPHPSTYYHQSRYLRPKIDQALKKPHRLSACIIILAKYPTGPSRAKIEGDIHFFMPALIAIDKALESMEQHQPPNNCARRLESRTELYAMAVKQWPVEDLKFVPNPTRWFSEEKYEQPAESWRRQPAYDHVQGREQLGRVFDELSKTGNGGHGPN